MGKNEEFISACMRIMFVTQSDKQGGERERDRGWGVGMGGGGGEDWGSWLSLVLYVHYAQNGL